MVFIIECASEGVATGERYLEAIIIDSKLSAGTGWTPNQTAAQKMTGWNVKSINDPIKGKSIPDLTKGTIISKTGEFKKIYKNGDLVKVE